MKRESQSGSAGESAFAPAGPGGYRQVVPGVRMKTLCHGSLTLMSEFRLDRGHELPMHAHPHEQTGYLVRGRLRMTIGEESREVSAGDSWSIPGGVQHGAVVLEDAVAVEVFSPVREDYLHV